MRQLLFALGFVFLCAPVFAQSNVKGPATSIVGDIAVWNNTTGSLVKDQPLGAIPYLITGGTTSRKDATRWNDNWTEAPEIGVDCTGTTDSTAALQAWVSANLNGGHIRFPLGCNVVITSMILVKDADGIAFLGQENFAVEGQVPSFIWKGTNGGSACATTFTSCVFMFDFEHSDHPMIKGLHFADGGSSSFCPDGALKFDGDFISDPSAHHTGTRGHIVRVSTGFNNCANPTSNFIAISISETAQNNHENYYLEDLSIGCTGTGLFGIGADGATTSGSSVLTSASNPFTSSMVSQRVRLSFAGTLFDTTIASFTNSGSVTLATAVPFTQTGLSMHLGGNSGIGIRNGHSFNAIQQVINRVTYFGCLKGIDVEGGNAFISDPQGGFSDIGIYLGDAVDRPMSVVGYAAESDGAAVVMSSQGGTSISLINGAWADEIPFGNGFIVPRNGTTVSNSGVSFTLPPSAVLFGEPYTMGVQQLGAIAGGSGYVNGTYTNVPLSSNITRYGGLATATVVVSGGSVTSVTITDAGIQNFGGDVLTTANTNIGGSGSDFSVPVLAAISAVQGGGGALSIGNNWIPGCCGSGTLTWTQLGFATFQVNGGLTSLNDSFQDPGTALAANIQTCNPGDGSEACSMIQAAMGGNATGPGFDVRVRPGIAVTADSIGIQVDTGGSPFIGGLTGTSWTANRALAATGGMVTYETMYEAAWNLQAIGAQGGRTLDNAYGFRTRTPTQVVGTLGNLYGFKCDQQKITGVTAAWCFYQDNVNDQNFFAGPTINAPTTVAALPTCNASLDGARMYVTDQNTAVSYRGAVTGGGSAHQPVVCNGSAWLQD